MKAMNFYTANGWAGSNYDSKLSTKEISAKVRSYAKKNFPEFKFSVRSEWSMYTDSMYIELKSGPCVPFVEGSRSAERIPGPIYECKIKGAWSPTGTTGGGGSVDLSSYLTAEEIDDVTSIL